jgi:tRNA dimethylallyltransferase
LPTGAKLKFEDVVSKKKGEGFYSIDGIKVWGYDLVSPKKEFSVASYMQFAHKKIKQILKRKKLPIIVGGTGLYIKGVVDGFPTAFIPKSKRLRKALDEKEKEELFEILAQLDPLKAASLNRSDKGNPRRLIRAIEVAQWEIKRGKYKRIVPLAKTLEMLFVGLFLPQKELAKKIGLRVLERLEFGFEKEIDKLREIGVRSTARSMQSLGYRQWLSDPGGTIPGDKLVMLWTREEIKYAKRQMIWFKKDSRIHWYDSLSTDYPMNVEKLAAIWYSSKRP